MDCRSWNPNERLLMRKFMILLSLVALAAPVAAFADAPPSPAQTANAMCAAAKTAMGASFATTYGTNASKANAFGKCVSSHAKAAKNAVTNASASCKAQQADANFASAHGGQTFAQVYGGSKNGNNAMGKCVSQAVQSTVAAQAKASKAALKSCKAAMKADKTAFATTYGSGKDALGKCVAAKSSTK
jgi:hypothetical protein